MQSDLLKVLLISATLSFVSAQCPVNTAVIDSTGLCLAVIRPAGSIYVNGVTTACNARYVPNDARTSCVACGPGKVSSGDSCITCNPLTEIVSSNKCVDVSSSLCPTNATYTYGTTSYTGKCPTPLLTNCLFKNEIYFNCMKRASLPAPQCGLFYFTAFDDFCVRACPINTAAFNSSRLCVAIRRPAGIAYVNGVKTACVVGSVPNDSRTECVACPDGKISSGDSCFTCDYTSQISSNNQCVTCNSTQIVLNNTCVECADGQSRNAYGKCVNPCSGNAFKNSLGVCTNCAAGQYALGSLCVASCSDSVGTPLRSINGCVATCSGIGSSLQAPAGTCWSGAQCPAGLPLYNILNFTCSDDCGTLNRVVYGGGSVCWKGCPGGGKPHVDVLGRNSCSRLYCPSSAPLLQIWGSIWQGQLGCFSACPSGTVLDVPTYQCVTACNTGESLVTNITGNPSVCKSPACSAHNHRNCPKTTLLSTLLPLMFAEPVPAVLDLDTSGSLNPNKVYDSITTLLYDAKTSSPSCSLLKLDGTLGCFETLIKTCFLNSASISSAACTTFQSKLISYPRLKDTVARLAANVSLVNILTESNQPIGAGKVAIIAIYNILGSTSSTVSGSYKSFNSYVEFYMTIAVLTSFIQNYNPSLVKSTLLRNYVEFFYFSLISVGDVSNLFMLDGYTAITRYLQTLGTSITTIKRSLSDDKVAFNENIPGDAFEKRMQTSTAFLAELIKSSQNQCSIDMLPGSAAGCLALGGYLKSVEPIISIIIYDAIFSESEMNDIYANCAGWVKAWSAVDQIDAPFNSPECRAAVANYCEESGYQSANCMMAFAVVSPVFTDMAEKRCPSEIGSSCRVRDGFLASV